jgi:hypothetical protein
MGTGTKRQNHFQGSKNQLIASAFMMAWYAQCWKRQTVPLMGRLMTVT